MNKEITNQERSIRAMTALDNYKVHILQDAGELGQDDLTDLLTDLRHLAGIFKENFNENFNFKDAVRRSGVHYKIEKKEHAA